MCKDNMAGVVSKVFTDEICLHLPPQHKQGQIYGIDTAAVWMYMYTHTHVYMCKIIRKFILCSGVWTAHSQVNNSVNTIVQTIHQVAVSPLHGERQGIHPRVSETCEASMGVQL
mmetsp:Transcript_96901/g.167104  ORF Transcript_96901/g.167104 Transcript_96901/m.167104 type:complete len:114 (-) Transcript_96901:844-1185(-)